jgi:hypothetical protein
MFNLTFAENPKLYCLGYFKFGRWTTIFEVSMKDGSVLGNYTIEGANFYIEPDVMVIDDLMMPLMAVQHPSIIFSVPLDKVQ